MVIGSTLAGIVLVLAAMNRPDILDNIFSMFAGKGVMDAYAVKFEEVGGLNANADVRFGGAKVGKVTAMELDADARRIVARIQVEDGVPVNTGSRAFISQATLTSEPHIEISVGAPEAPLLLADTGITAGVETYDEDPVIPTEPGGLFGAVSKLAGDLRELIGVDKARATGLPFTTVADVVDNVNLTLDDGRGVIRDTGAILNQRNEDLGRILEQDIDPILEHTEAMMASGRQFAGTMSDSADLVKTWIEENDDRLSATAQSAQTIAKDIETLTAELEAYKTKVATILDNGDALSGDARILLERNGPVVEDMLGDLREAMRFFVSFAEVLADNPQALLRGQREGGRETSTQGTLGREPDR